MESNIKIHSNSNNRLTLGYLTYYQNQMMTGVIEAAQKHDVNLIAFTCNLNVDRKNHPEEIHALFDIIKNQDLDGLMFLGWIEIIGIDMRKFQDFFKSIPLFSLGACFKNIPNAYMEGSPYFRDILIHLIEAHQCRKIGYLSPILPDKRDDVYVEVMKKYHLYNPGLVVSAGDLKPVIPDLNHRAKQAVHILLEERALPVDAIASMYNDEALSIIEELRIRKINVPDDIKVIGYEDKDMGKYSTPTLSTIYFPFWEIGYYGCERFIEMLTSDHIDIPFSTLIPGKVILRGSCGCISGSVSAVNSVKIIGSRKKRNLSDKKEKQIICNELNKIIYHSVIDIDHLVDTFFSDYEKHESRNFINELTKQIGVYIGSHSEVSPFEDFISFLRKMILSYLKGNEAELAWVEDIFHKARIYIEEKAINIYGHQLVLTNELHMKLQEISVELMTTFNSEKLFDILELNLPRINLPSSYIFLYDDNEKTIDECNLVFHYMDYRRIYLDTNNVFPAKHIPAHLFPHYRRYTMIGHILHVKNEQLGFIFFEPGPLDERIYMSLSAQLSTALQGAELLSRLKDTNIRLKTAQTELIDKAHKAGMADIAIGTLHNVGNVLNNINTSVQMLKDILKETPLSGYKSANELLKQNMDRIEHFICDDPKGKKLMQYYIMLENQFDETQNQFIYHLNRLVEKNNLIKEIIRAQQSYAGAQPILEDINLVTVIEDALTMLSASFIKYNIEIIKHYERIPVIPIQKVKLYHVLVNIFSNAKEALLDIPEGERKIIINVYSDQTGIIVKITDTGQGIPAELLERIFSYGFTTKKEGHGFGLHTCANYMTEMNGKIWVESPGVGKGTSFFLRFK